MDYEILFEEKAEGLMFTTKEKAEGLIFTTQEEALKANWMTALITKKHQNVWEKRSVTHSIAECKILAYKEHNKDMAIKLQLVVENNGVRVL